LLAFFFAYGGWNLAQDFWLEQVVKRGATSVELPYVIAPAATPAWGLVVVIAAAVFVVVRREHLRTPPAS
jgi:TRAP-type C4-dicarboxylate transport system permease small subunit